ncbi:MAG: ABC-three component system protein [Planctomycetota bacterium]
MIIDYESLTPEQQLFARVMFRNRIYQSNGQRYEDLFVSVMTLRDSRFRPVKPQGRKGDQGNDGFIPEAGKYFQVYAPEDAKAKISEAAEKAKTDFSKLQKHWEKDAPITDFRFVHNDKFQGAFPDVEHEIAELKRTHNLTECKAFLAKDLEAEFCKLSKPDMEAVLQSVIPRSQEIADIDYGVFAEILQHLVESQAPIPNGELGPVPSFTEKMRFNGIEATASLLTVGSYQNAAVDEFFNRHGEFTRTDIRNRLADGYNTASTVIGRSQSSETPDGDRIFFELLRTISTAPTKPVQDAAIVLIAYFFEKCDVFKAPDE